MRLDLLHPDSDGQFRPRPLTITIIYLIFGAVWIGVTDWALLRIVEDASIHRWVETGKGLLFVLISAVLLYLLLHIAFQKYRNANDELRTTFLEVSILHRILRHNLRNSATVIAGHVDMIDEEGATETNIEALSAETDRLIDLADRARFLHRVASEESVCFEDEDVAERLRTVAQKHQDTHPDAEIDVDVPSERVPVPRYFDIAVAELVENAITHTDAETPTVRITVEHTSDGALSIQVSDNGPGIPDLERRTLDKASEGKLEHSQGLGLWVVKFITENAGGDVRFQEGDRDGTTVELWFPPESVAD